MPNPVNRVLLVGNIGTIGELRHVGDGKNSVINFSIATTERVREGDTWVDGETIWSNCTAWGRLAENIATTLASGDRVIASGVMRYSAPYTTRNGQERPASVVYTIDELGLNISTFTIDINRENRGGSGKSAPDREQSPRREAPRRETPAARPEPKPEPEVTFDDVDSSDSDDIFEDDFFDKF